MEKCVCDVCMHNNGRGKKGMSVVTSSW